MRILFLCLLSVFPLHAKFALADIQIEEVGLKGYYTTATPTPVRIHLSAPQTPGPLYLEFKVAQQDFVPGMPLRVDRYSLHVEVPSDAASELDVPVPISGPDASKLANDRLTTDTYDNDGNTVSFAGTENAYTQVGHRLVDAPPCDFERVRAIRSID